MHLITKKKEEKKTRTFLINIHSIYLHIHAATFLFVILKKERKKMHIERLK
jgi:hypothetical protein